jgi:hypothetical protein
MFVPVEEAAGRPGRGILLHGDTDRDTRPAELADRSEKDLPEMSESGVQQEFHIVFPQVGDEHVFINGDIAFDIRAFIDHRLQ